ncbi:hypothetical protein [Prosthecobacter sp.]|uniref:hypothetical protein n=1 Tax=Prosthecobacter sp. TaxID=1965333 RepID=UPI00378506D7
MFHHKKDSSLGLCSTALIFAFFTACIAGCVSRLFLGVDREMLSRLESTYQQVFALENQYDDTNIGAFVSHLNRMASGADLEGGPPYWFSEQKKLLELLNQVQLNEMGQRRLRMHLMKKFGIVSSVIELPRSAAVKVYVSIPDRFRFEYGALEKLFNGDVPPNSKLLKSMLDKPNLYK